MSEPGFDPFGGQSIPAISFDDLPVGTRVAIHVTEPAKWVQTIDWVTKAPAFWPPNSDGTQNPKMAAVVHGNVNGELRALWAPFNSKKATDDRFAAVRDAQVRAGAKIGPGGVLTIWQTGAVPSSKGNPRKTFAAEYAPAAAADPFSGQSATPAPAPAIPPAPPAQPTATGPVSVPQTAAPVVDLAAVKAKLAPLAAAGLSAAQIAGMAPSVGITAPDGSALTEASVAAILAA